MAKEKIVLKSTTKGLWARTISELIGYWLGGYWFVVVLSWLLVSPLLIDLFTLFAVAVVVYYTYCIWQDNPQNWGKEVAFDFAASTITILRTSTDDTNSEILDLPVRTIAFDEIERLLGRPYESFFFASIYRITVITKGEEVKLVALDSPNDYTDLLNRFRQSGIMVG